jgi:hypothetical protein
MATFTRLAFANQPRGGPQPVASITPPRTSRKHPRLHLLRQWQWALAALHLGPHHVTHPGARTYRQLWDRTLVLEATVTGLVELLIERKLVTEAEVYERTEMAATDLDRALQREHPGATPTPDGMTYERGRQPWRLAWQGHGDGQRVA